MDALRRLFLGLNALIWALLFLLAGMPLQRGFGYLGIFLGIHLAVVAGRSWLAKFEAWQAGRGNRPAPTA